MVHDSAMPIAKLVPSFITVAALCLGLLSVRYAFAEQWELSMLFIVAAGMLDAMDGKVARLLGTDSIFGAQLDSLCDLLNFGLCPAITLYMWGLYEVKTFGWALVMIYVSCMAIRLARFNAMAIKKSGGAGAMRPDLFFIGVPAPAGATLLLLPIMLSLSAASNDVFDQRLSPTFMQIYMLIVSLLLVSPIPTFSFKVLRVGRVFMPLLIGCFVLFFVCTALKPWITIPVVCVAYIISIPFSALISFYINRIVSLR